MSAEELRKDMEKRQDFLPGGLVPVKKKTLWDITKQNPFLTIGIAGGIGILCWRIFSISRRNKKHSFSMYLLETRVYAQGFIVFGLGLYAANMEWQRRQYKKAQKKANDT